jgi:tRNA nucleotidyltransferase/poly(A) polymerase
MNPHLPLIAESHKLTLSQPFELSPHLKMLLYQINKSHGKAILVGGSVRDHMRGYDAKDLDI